MSMTTTQHENGAGRPFAFLPKRTRSRSSPPSKHEIDENDMLHDNDRPAYSPANVPSTSTASASERHVFPRTTKQSMHIDIPPPPAVIPAPGRPVAAPIFLRKKSGELVKPSLKSTSSFAAPSPSPPPSTSPPSSVALRPRTTSAPATPSASKSVHFDTQLEHVKLFLAGQKPLAVSREGSPVDMDTTSASEAELDSFGISSYPFPSSKPRYGASTSATSNSMTSKSQSQTRMNLKLIPIYTPSAPPNPSAEPWTFDVRVESVRLSTPESTSGAASSSSQDTSPHLYGTVLVHNKAFSKSVFFRYTLDDWNTVSEVSCKHVHTLPDGSYDRFEYRVKLLGVASTRSPNAVVSNVAARPGSTSSAFGSSSSRSSPSSPPPRMEFCVRYNVPSHGEWWDSNGGRNYVVEFKWERELPSPSPLVQQATKIVAPQPQRAVQNGSNPLWQRLTRHSIPPSSGTVSPGHISPPPNVGNGASSSVSSSHQRSPMHSPSFPPAFPALGHSDYFNYNRPQAMNIPLRSRYDFGVSWREGAKVTGPAVTSPPPSAGILSPNAGTSALPPLEGNRSPPGRSALLSPTPTHGMFRHTLATPAKKTLSPTQSPERALSKDLEEAGEISTPSSATLTLGSPTLAPTDVETTYTLDEMPSGLNLETSQDDFAIPSTSSYAFSAVSPSPTSPSGRRHVRSWIQTSASEQDMSNSDGRVWAGLGVRKTMSSPAGLAAEETTSPVIPKRQYHRQQLPHFSQSSRQHHLTNDGDEEEESEEDGIWFGRRNSIGAVDELSRVGNQQASSSSSSTNAVQSDYDVLTDAMRSTVLDNASRSAHARTPSSVRFKDLGVLGVVNEAGDQDVDDETSIVEMEMGDSSESSSSASSSTTTSPTSSHDAISGMKAEVGRTSPSWSPSTASVATPTESPTLPLLNAKLARAILSGTPKSASPSFLGVENIDVDSVTPLNIGTLSDALRTSTTSHILTSPPSSEGSTTPKAEIPNPMDSLIPSGRTSTSAASVGLGGINLNSSSYYSLLDQFCFFTGSSSRNTQAYLPAKNQAKPSSPIPQTATTTKETSPERSTDYRQAIGRRGNGVGGARSSSADSPPAHTSSGSDTLSSSPPHGANGGFGFNFGFGFDGLASVSMNDTFLSPRYALSRSLSDPSEHFLVRSAYGGEQVSGSVG